MTVRFVDTYYLIALVNTKDKGHKAALQLSRGQAQRLLMTTWVIVEFADALSAISTREKAATFVRQLLSRRDVEIVPPSRQQFERAFEFYEQRPDKNWSLTDCMSFQLMKDRGVTEALTADHHFEQAGFQALMRQSDES